MDCLLRNINRSKTGYCIFLWNIYFIDHEMRDGYEYFLLDHISPLTWCRGRVLRSSRLPRSPQSPWLPWFPGRLGQSWRSGCYSSISPQSPRSPRSPWSPRRLRIRKVVLFGVSVGGGVGGVGVIDNDHVGGGIDGVGSLDGDRRRQRQEIPK